MTMLYKTLFRCSNQPVRRGRAREAKPEPDAHRVAGARPGGRRANRCALGLHDLQRLPAPPTQQRAGRHDPPRLGQRLPAGRRLHAAARRPAAAVTAHVRICRAAAPCRTSRNQPLPLRTAWPGAPSACARSPAPGADRAGPASLGPRRGGASIQSRPWEAQNC